MLDLPSDIESRIRDYAVSSGVSVHELIVRTFPPRSPQPNQKVQELIEAIRQWQAEDATEDTRELDQRTEDSAALHANLDNLRERAGMRRLFPDEA